MLSFVCPLSVVVAVVVAVVVVAVVTVVAVVVNDLWRIKSSERSKSQAH